MGASKTQQVHINSLASPQGTRLKIPGNRQTPHHRLPAGRSLKSFGSLGHSRSLNVFLETISPSSTQRTPNRTCVQTVSRAFCEQLLFRPQLFGWPRLGLPPARVRQLAARGDLLGVRSRRAAGVSAGPSKVSLCPRAEFDRQVALKSAWSEQGAPSEDRRTGSLSATWQPTDRPTHQPTNPPTHQPTKQTHRTNRTNRTEGNIQGSQFCLYIPDGGFPTLKVASRGEQVGNNPIFPNLPGFCRT